MTKNRKLRVLLVEPDADLSSTVMTLLELAGCEVATTTSGIGAIDRASTFSADVVIAELVLHDISGFELAKQLSASPQTENALLIAMTGFPVHGAETAALEAGFCHYIAKPAPLSQIVDTLAPIAKVLGCLAVALPE
jgi:CheY-like chemotaxis protein